VDALWLVVKGSRSKWLKEFHPEPLQKIFNNPFKFFIILGKTLIFVVI
jgi:hypothetical protein